MKTQKKDAYDFTQKSPFGKNQAEKAPVGNAGSG
jgi:hypothetical protein